MYLRQLLNKTFMGNFNRGGNKFGGKKSFGGDRGGFRGNDRGDRPQMFHATCAECGKDCEVPFKPSGSKPVYCSNCFGKKDGGNDRFERRGSDKFSFGDKPMFKAVCDSCGKDCEVPFRPTGEKPVYCKDCFGKSEKSHGSSAPRMDQYKSQLDELNKKLDDILKMLSPKSSVEKTIKAEKPVLKPAKKAVVKKVVVKKPTKKKK